MTFMMREPLPPGGHLIRTASFQLVQEAGAAIYKSHGMLVVEGLSGTGKTVSVEYLVSQLGAEWVTVHLANRARGNEVAIALARGLGARDLAPGGLAARMACKQLLMGRNVVIFVDEADRLNADGLRCLRYLWDQPGRTWCLIVVGIDFDKAFALVPEIANRKTRYVPFDRLGWAALRKALTTLHPLFAATDPHVLEALDNSSCHGVLVSWTILLHALLAAGADPTAGVTLEFAGRVLATIDRPSKKGRRR